MNVGPGAMDAAEPLRPWRGAPTRGPDRVCRVPFEYTSRGDRVPGVLWLPSETPAPLVLLISDVPEAATQAAGWAEAGLAVARLDPPLVGARASAKLAARVLDVPERSDPSAFDRSLWSSFARQLASDAARALDLLVEQPEIDPGRLAFAGFGRGALCGAAWCADDPRVAAVALVGLRAGSGMEPSALERIEPRPLLLLDAERVDAAAGLREDVAPERRAERVGEFLSDALAGVGRR